MGITQRSPGGFFVVWGFVLHVRNEKLRKSEDFIMGCKEVFEIFVVKRDIMFLYWTISKLALYYLYLPTLFILSTSFKK